MRIIPAFRMAVHGLFGVGGVLGGAAALLLPTGWLPASAPSLSPEEMHLTQELGCAAIVVGLLALRCLREYQRSRGGHYLLMVFFGLMALVHWMDFFRDLRPILSPVLNTAPIALLTMVLLLDHPASDAVP